MPKKTCDFSGYATRYELECSDGLTIKGGCFKHQDGKKVPLVWNHGHSDIHDVIGHCVLENRKDGVYAYVSLNNTDGGVLAKELVSHGDIDSFSIYANKLKCKGKDVMHGDIKEVSLCLAGANPGAFIDNVAIAHSADSEVEYEDVEIITKESSIELSHSEESSSEEETNLEKEEKSVEETQEIEHADEEGKTLQEVFDSMTEEQQTCCQALIGLALEQQKEEQQTVQQSDNMEENEMPRNIFENKEGAETEVTALSHSDLNDAFIAAKKAGCESLREAMKESLSEIKHSVSDINNLYPDAKAVGAPETVDIEQGWASEVMASVHRTPFKNVKSSYFDLTVEGARARGFVKGNQKAEQVVATGKRNTTPQTVYVKQTLHRDDILDAEDFDIVSYLKAEMDVKLKEEVARAILVGDGRSVSSDDKINPINIRPILGDTENDFYVVSKTLAKVDNDDSGVKFAKKFISQVRVAKKEYKGSGAPAMYINSDLLAACLEIEDTNGRYIYADEVALARALRVSRIVEVPVMDNVVREGAEGKDYKCMAIMVNLKDYNVGGGKGRDNGWFEDFDINLNKNLYLTETRLSGAMTKYHGAITFEQEFAHVA